MRARRTIIGTISGAPIFRNLGTRRLILAALVVLFIILGFFPERYRAAVTLTPSDPASFGLSGSVGQLGAINSAFTNQTTLEIALKVRRSMQVREMVASRLKLAQRNDFKNQLAMHRWLKDAVDVRSFCGGIIQFDCYMQDAAFARALVGAFASATQERLAQISRQQTDYKRAVLVNLVSESSDRLARARGAYDTFRLQARYADPVYAIDAIGQRIPALEAAIKQKEVDLTAARQFATDNSMSVRQILAQLGALRGQLAQAQATNPTQSNSVGRVVSASTQAEKLARELRTAQTIYDNYVRVLEGTSVEVLTSSESVRILEPPFVDTERQFNTVFLAIALALSLFWAALEFYRLAPPIGERTIVRKANA